MKLKTIFCTSIATFYNNAGEDQAQSTDFYQILEKMEESGLRYKADVIKCTRYTYQKISLSFGTDKLFWNITFI